MNQVEKKNQQIEINGEKSERDIAFGMNYHNRMANGGTQ